MTTNLVMMRFLRPLCSSFSRKAAHACEAESSESLDAVGAERARRKPRVTSSTMKFFCTSSSEHDGPFRFTRRQLTATSGFSRSSARITLRQWVDIQLALCCRGHGHRRSNGRLSGNAIELAFAGPRWSMTTAMPQHDRENRQRWDAPTRVDTDPKTGQASLPAG